MEPLAESALALALDEDFVRPSGETRLRRAPGRETTDGEGHRARLRQRLFEGGAGALADHEIVEYLLGLSIKRLDTKGLAKRLLKEFGGLGPLLAADPRTIRRRFKLSDSSIAALKIVQAAISRLLEKEVDRRPVLGSWAALIDYLHAEMGHLPVEQVRVLYLNTRNELVGNEVLSEGSIDESAVYVREVMRGAIDRGAAAIILVHNHPSGDPSPSQQDIRLTRDLVEAAKHLRIDIHDHVIVGAKGHSSLRGLGLI